MIATRHLFLACCSSTLVCLLSGCASTGPLPPSNRFLVSVKSAQFYKYGPAQAFGPDFTLSQGHKVTMLNRESGYSRVMLDDGTSGYMATEELNPAPPEPPPPKLATNRNSRAGGGWFSSGKPKRSNVLPTPTDPLFDVTDVPLPLPDEEPATTPKPDSSDSKPDPDFRF